MWKIVTVAKDKSKRSGKENAYVVKNMQKSKWISQFYFGCNAIHVRGGIELQKYVAAELSGEWSCPAYVELSILSSDSEL